MEDIKGDLERLASSISPVISRQKTYATSHVRTNIEEEPKFTKRKLQAEYSEHLRMQIRLKEEARVKERDLEKRLEKIETKESKPLNLALEKYKVDIRKDYEEYLSYVYIIVYRS